LWFAQIPRKDYYHKKKGKKKSDTFGAGGFDSGLEASEGGNYDEAELLKKILRTHDEISKKRLVGEGKVYGDEAVLWGGKSDVGEKKGST